MKGKENEKTKRERRALRQEGKPPLCQHRAARRAVERGLAEGTFLPCQREPWLQRFTLRLRSFRNRNVLGTAKVWNLPSLGSLAAANTANAQLEAWEVQPSEQNPGFRVRAA